MAHGTALATLIAVQPHFLMSHVRWMACFSALTVKSVLVNLFQLHLMIVPHPLTVPYPTANAIMNDMPLRSSHRPTVLRKNSAAP